jgi:hypothetical protein
MEKKNKNKNQKLKGQHKKTKKQKNKKKKKKKKEKRKEKKKHPANRRDNQTAKGQPVQLLRVLCIPRVTPWKQTNFCSQAVVI